MNFADNNILLLLISLAFIYAVLSILVSIIVEWFNYMTKERGKHLRDSIHNLITDRQNVQLGEQFYNHITIAGLQNLKNRLPDYISCGMFAEAFVDVISQQAPDSETPAADEKDENNKPVKRVMQRFEDGVQQMPEGQFRNLLQSFIDKSGNDYTQLKKHLEVWYDDYMERVSGWYKLNQRYKLIIAGFLVTLALNVDSLHLIKVLSLDDDLKQRIVSEAEKVTEPYKNMNADTRENMVAFNEQITKSIEPALKQDSLAPTQKKLMASSSLLNYSRLVQFKHMLKQTDSLTNCLMIKDSVTRQSVNQLDKGMELLSQLNIPIGWSCDNAPLSWFYGSNDSLLPNYNGNSVKTASIIRYLKHRNETMWDWNGIKYLIGIIISGISLSFGAPFWFDMLVKLVNIRRAGKVPEVSKK